MSKTFQPDSLHPYIMDARLKKATGSGGISNIPIASADTVGGIMIGGSANPITIDDSGNASVRKATSELLGVVKAGDGVSIDADGAISGIAYSTTEHLTGRKWLDGKDIYEKTILLENVTITANQGVVVGENFGIDKTVNAILRVESENGTASIGLWINGSNQIVFQSPASYAQGNVYVTIQYTKTTP